MKSSRLALVFATAFGLSGCIAYAPAPSNSGRAPSTHAVFEVCFPDSATSLKDAYVVTYRQFDWLPLPYRLVPAGQTTSGQLLSKPIYLDGPRLSHSVMLLKSSGHPDKLYAYEPPNRYPAKWGAWTVPQSIEEVEPAQLDSAKFFRGKPNLTNTELASAPKIRWLFHRRDNDTVNRTSSEPRPPC